MEIPIYQVDAFTNEPFKGNPAAVCLLEEEIPDTLMAAIAGEMNLSETAYLLPEAAGYRLRWFTPQVEVKLCGHATLASAHTLFALEKLNPDETIIFFTLSGDLAATSRDGMVELNFPTRPVKHTALPACMIDALGVGVLQASRFEKFYLVEVADEEEVMGVDPDFNLLSAVDARGLMVTSLSTTPGVDFVSRYFAPWVGVNEDPVTGSAHCCLMPYWAERLGKTELRAYQASSRGGHLNLRLYEDRVYIAGEAVMVMKGVFEDLEEHLEDRQHLEELKISCSRMHQEGNIMPEVATKRLKLISVSLENLIRIRDGEKQIEESGEKISLLDPIPYDVLLKAMGVKISIMSEVEICHHPWFTYWLIVIPGEQVSAGMIGFKGLPDESGEVEVGYGIEPAFRGKGYATEAARALVAWAFDDARCKTVMGDARKNNPASLRVMEKIGMKKSSETDDMVIMKVRMGAVLNFGRL